MIKKTLCLVFSLITMLGLCLSSIAIDSSANITDTQTAEYFSDGSYIITSLYEDSVTTRAKIYNKSGGKILTFYNNDGEKMWDVELRATFKVNEGVSVSCTAVSFTAPRIYNSTWRYITNTTSKSGNKASGTITMKKYFMGLPVRTETPTVTITCDKYGKLS